ncbi:MAG: hypothetical protein K5657_09395 [Desulfovibrio sp.]|nr:hypothetical protein [Desulfovibrio sp.]
MKKLFASFVVAAAITVFAGAAMAKEVIIANGCSFPLHFIGLSRSTDTQAENLISEPVKPGDGIRVTLNVTSGIDLTVQDDDGGQIDFQNLDLTNASKVTLKNDGTADIE